MKKKIIISILIITGILYLLPAKSQSQAAPSTDKIKWMDFEEAVDMNQKKPKKIFIDMYTDWCGWCKKMDASTFVNPVIVKYMNDNFYAVKFNAERKDEVTFKGKNYVNGNPTGSRSSHQLAQELLNGRMSYPSFVFMDESLNKITILPGFQKAPQFEAVLHFIAKDIYKTQKFEEFRAGFQTTAVE